MLQVKRYGKFQVKCPNTPSNVRNAVGGVLQVVEHDNLSNYLGLPTAIGHNRKEIFNFVKDKD